MSYNHIQLKFETIELYWNFFLVYVVGLGIIAEITTFYSFFFFNIIIIFSNDPFSHPPILN